MTSYTDELLRELLSEVKGNSSKPMLILQGVTLGLLILKPVLMYFIQAKYNAPPPHESILRNVDEEGVKEYRNEMV